MQKVMRFFVHFETPYTIDEIKAQEIELANEIFDYDIFHKYLFRWTMFLMFWSIL